MNVTSQRCLILAAAACITFGGGCSELTTEYGRTSGSSAYSSINGYGTFRLAMENSGIADRDVVRLTDRLKKDTDILVWAPQNLNPLNPEAVNWIDSWLKTGNRLLIYIAPDNGCEVEYWEKTRPLAPAEKRLEYRRRAAKSRTERMVKLSYGRYQPSYKWFSVNHLSKPEKIKASSGPWTTANDSNQTSEAPWTPLENGVAKGKQGKTKTGGQTPPLNANFQSLLQTGNGTTYVAEIKAASWNNSKIIVVSAGSLLSNFGLTQRPNQLLADRIIQDAVSLKTSDLNAGFLNNNGMPLAVSSSDDGVQIARGMEFLTVWPVSLLTMHGMFLGLIICIALWPIFGRPRRIMYQSKGNFGDNLNAVAALMNNVGGKQYARRKISDYMQRIRGETSGPWIIKELGSDASPAARTVQPGGLAKRAQSNPSTEQAEQSESQSRPNNSQDSSLPSPGMSESANSQTDGKKIE